MNQIQANQIEIDLTIHFTNEKNYGISKAFNLHEVSYPLPGKFVIKY